MQLSYIFHLIRIHIYWNISLRVYTSLHFSLFLLIKAKKLSFQLAYKTATSIKLLLLVTTNASTHNLVGFQANGGGGVKGEKKKSYQHQEAGRFCLSSRSDVLFQLNKQLILLPESEILLLAFLLPSISFLYLYPLSKGDRAALSFCIC